MTSNLTQQAITAFAQALQAERYNLRLVDFDDDQAKPIGYTPAQLTDGKTVAFLRRENSQGFNVYVRPVGWQYVLLDDLTIQALQRMKMDDIRPCVLLETSPANYQAWVILPDQPASREEAKAICRYLASRYGADLCSAEPDHVGRLPGLTNRKPKYQQPNGYFPFVRLCKAEHRLANLSTPVGGWVLNDTGMDSAHAHSRLRSIPAHASQKTASEHDFGIVLGLLKKGWEDDRIRAHMIHYSPDIIARKARNLDNYITKTISKARSLL